MIHVVSIVVSLKWKIFNVILKLEVVMLNKH